MDATTQATDVAASDPGRTVQELLERQRRAFVRDGFPPADLRIDRLDRLVASLIAHESRIVDAIAADLGQSSRYETRWLNLATVIADAKYCRQHVTGWMEPERRTPERAFRLLGARAEVRYQPLGVVGILSPWNAPMLRSFGPLSSVLAAGNRAMIKPSDRAPASAGVIGEIVSRAFDACEVAVVTGGAEVGAALAGLPLDHLVFTGRRSVARQVMQAAAANLVPVTLELGGKCPAIIGQTADLVSAARKIMHGKCANAGQTCLAPDYLLVPARCEEQLVQALRYAVARMFPTGLVENHDYSAVIDAAHKRRIESYLEDAREKGATLIELNPQHESFDAQVGYKLPPTLVLTVRDHMALAHDEIFGPVLPIVRYTTIEDALDYVSSRAHPLAVYYFGDDPEERERVLAGTISGGVTINDIFLHGFQQDLPFGGVGPSGMGAYHAREGFLRFSHARSVFVQANLDLFGALLRPPYGLASRKLLSAMIKH